MNHSEIYNKYLRPLKTPKEAAIKRVIKKFSSLWNPLNSIMYNNVI